MAKELKSRIALYYGTSAVAMVKAKANLLRQEGSSVTVIDSAAFDGNLEDVNDLCFMDVKEDVEQRIRDAYEGRARETIASAPVIPDEIRIPEDWEDLPFPEMQKLAAALSDQAVRSKDAAFEIIAAEVERRCADIDGDDLDADLDQDTDGSEEGDDDDEGDDDADAGENSAQTNTEAAPKRKRNRRNRR